MANPNWFKQQEIMAKLGPFIATLLPSSGPVQHPVQPQAQAQAAPKEAALEKSASEKPKVDPADQIYDIEMVSFTAAGKIRVIKEYRALVGLGIKEAKDKVEKVPFVAFKSMRKDEADAMVKKFEGYGAKMRLI